MSQGTSLVPKDKGPSEDNLKAVGTKRLHTDASSSPVYHNVYVRRKVETEHSKVNSSQELKGNGRGKTKEHEEQRNVETEHSKVNSSQELKGNGRDKTKEHEEQQNVETEHSKVSSSQELKGNERDKTKEQKETEHSQVNSCQELKYNGSGKTKEQDERRVQHDHINKPEVPPPIAESGIKEEEERQMVQHGQLNRPEVAPHIAESGTKQQEERQGVQNEQVNKPELPPPIAESGIKEKEECQTVQHDQINRPELPPPITEPVGLVPSEMASPIAEPLGPVPSESPEKTNAETAPEENEPAVIPANEPLVTPGTTVEGDIHMSGNQNPYWSERYIRLQTYLENCDRSPQEGYMQMLRSLSAAGRSLHAIELEKRAIHLLVGEGKELQRMKSLNVLGKSPPNGSSKQAPLQR
nr:uncharacterized protein LOC127336796 isoform X5 [Lolium perenne]